MKKEAVITIICSLILVAFAAMLSGCSMSGKQMDGTSKSDWDILMGLAQMEKPNSCLMCFGCVNMKSPADCCGNSDYTYVGCVDCLGVTAQEGDTETGIEYVEICGGYSCLTFNTEVDGKSIPVIGCYQGS